MLAITSDAALLIRRLLERAELPDTAGLRLGMRDDRPSLEMGLVPYPREDDVVLDQGGVALFLSPRALERTGSQTLHASLDRPAFYLE